MDTFGEKLRSVREDRGLTIESASDATGVGAHRLRALEANDFDSLPGEEVILATLRAYAAYLSVDADLMIEDYRYERERRTPPLEAPTDPGTPDDLVQTFTSLEPPRAIDEPPPPSEDEPPPPSEDEPALEILSNATPPPSGDETSLEVSDDTTIPLADHDLPDDEPRPTPPPECTEEPLEPYAPSDSAGEAAQAASEKRKPASNYPESLRPGPATPPAEASRFSLWLAAMGVLAVAAFAVWWFGSGRPVDRAPETFRPSATTAVKSEAPAATVPAVLDHAVKPSVESGARRVTEPVDVASRDPEPRPEPIAMPSDPTEPSIRDYGVGTGVRNRQLVGESGRFDEGTQVWFWTHVQGADPGDRIHHVWLHDGVEAARVKLKIGGSSWRTHSAKTLWPGSSGDWVVEARDEAGRVLAREAFVCDR
jgi:transcriptional regulator with XRE-family HTH domain